MELADRRNLSIISADSRQIYRGFDIGTAKASRAEQARVPHFGVDICEATDQYSASRWASDVERWERAAEATGRQSVIVGGTGFYVRALVHPLDQVPPLDLDRRRRLAQWLESLDQESVKRWCERLDPSRAHLGRTQRLRAIETALLAGAPISDFLLNGPGDKEGTNATAARYLVVDPGAPLAVRIADRVDRMLVSGWPDEVERLLQSAPPDAPAWKASGYGQLRAAVRGEQSLAAARERIVIETRQYAKRQRTWNRHQLSPDAVTVINPDDADALERALRWWDANAWSDG